MKAKSAKELEQMIEAGERKKTLKATCFLQLRKKQLPYSCYDWLAVSSVKDKTFFLKYFDEKCGEFSGPLKNPKKILKQTHLSKFCRKKVLQQRNKMRYLLRDKSPEELFRHGEKL